MVPSVRASATVGLCVSHFPRVIWWAMFPSGRRTALAYQRLMEEWPSCSASPRRSASVSIASRAAASCVSVVWMCASPVTMSWSDSVWAVVKSPNFFCMPGKVQPPTDKNGRACSDRRRRCQETPNDAITAAQSARSSNCYCGTRPGYRARYG